MFVAIFADVPLQVYFKRCLVCISQQSLFNTLSCIYFLLFFGCGSYACFFCFVSSFFLAVLPLGHLPPLSHRRSFCFVRTQWPSGSGIRDHPLLHGLLKNPSLNAAWYVLVFLVESCFRGVVSVRKRCLRCISNLSLSCRVWARPCSAWKCGYNQKSSWKSTLGFPASSLANTTASRLKDNNFVLLCFFPMLLTWQFSLGCQIRKALLSDCGIVTCQWGKRVVVCGCWWTGEGQSIGSFIPPLFFSWTHKT